MPRFLTIGYGDAQGYARTPQPVRDAAHRQDAALAAAGAITAIARRAVQVRNPEGRGVEVAQGPYMTAPLPVAGFSVLEAESLEAAIRMVSTVPCAVAHGVVEVWPLEDDHD
jgi:hypothetical protein